MELFFLALLLITLAAALGSGYPVHLLFPVPQFLPFPWQQLPAICLAAA